MSNFSYAFFLLSKPQRQALRAFYGFCRAVDDITDGHLPPFLAKDQLDEWREEIGRLYKGYPTKPETVAMTELVDQYAIDADLLYEIIDGVNQDLTICQYQTFEGLKAYCYKVASVVGLVAIEIFGYQNPASRLFAENLGIALQLTNIIRDVGEDIDRGRLYLPQEDLDQFDVLKTEIISKKQTPAFLSLMRFQTNRANEWYQKAYQALPEEDLPNLSCAIAMGRIYHELLCKISAQKYPVLKKRVSLSSWQKMWIVMHTRMQCKK